MAQPSGTFDSYDAVGNREDLADIIYNISPTETPFMMMIGRGKAKNRYTEWQLDSLAAVDEDNAVIEGDDAILDDSTPTERVGNVCQISDKTVVVTGSQEAINKAGRKSDLAYQIAKKGKELRRDMEAILCRNQASVAGDSSTARRTGSMEAWIETNVSRGSGGTSGGFDGVSTVDAAGDGTQRALTETLFKNVIRDAWTNGGEPTVAMTGAVNKQNISGFTGNSTRMDKGEDKRLTASVDVYVHDYGTIKVVPNRFSRDRSVAILDPKLWAVRYLRGFRIDKLAKTGDSEKRQLLAEYALMCKNEAGSGIIADLTTS